MKKLIATAFSIVSLLAAPSLWAATQGSEGVTSSGTSDISVVVPKLVKITGIADLSQTYNGGAGGFDQNDDVCIYSNMDTGSGTYSVTVTGSANPKAGGTAGFYVGNLTTDQEKPYTVSWHAAAGTAGGTALTSGSPLASQAGFTNSAACASNNANFHVQMTQSDLLTLRPATYTGTITILITPD